MSAEDDNLEFHGKQQYPMREDDFDASGNDDDSPISGDDDNEDTKDDFDINHNNGNHFESDDDDNDDKIVNNETFSDIDVDVCGDKDNADDGGDEAKNDNDDVDDDDDDDLTETKTPVQSFIIFESTTITPTENIKNNLRSQTSCDVFTKEESNRDDYRNDDDDHDDDHVCIDDDVGGEDDQKNDTLSSSHVLDSKVNQDETLAKESENREFKLKEISVKNMLSPSWKQNEESSNLPEQLNLRSIHGSNSGQFKVKDGKSFINNAEVQDGKSEIEIKQAPPPRMNRKKLADDWLAKIKSSSIVSEDAKIKVISSLAPNVRDVWKKREELSMEGSLRGCHLGGFEENMKECSIEGFDKQECTASQVMKRTPSYRSQGSSTVPNVVTYTNTGVKTRVNIAGNYLNYQPLKDPYRGVDRYGLIKMINDSKAKIIDLENENQNLKNVLEQQQTQSK